MGIHARFNLANRAAIEAEIERLISMLDDLDGDCDIEEDDPAGGNVEDERQAAEGEEFFRLLPRYGLDQTLGPINELEAYGLHRREMGCLDA